ncbi:NADH:flavin oxidoreductase/NADH oxidase [Roridomyces roridus]|uniref:NADH:flavin oxidoreductase/NADH oxidase n=1 Tax=Roridomyces roridus TaxID=1738132 RepID=A0AAD7FVR3_9AGAR|nr:NADH:flavin oxidoreductase/NADH oxidase [Roridomyces roridus]
MSIPKLFQPTRVGDVELAHRVVLAPTTRFRADSNHAPLPHVAEYYGQRASTSGSLLISEATFIAARAGGYPNAPGIWSDEQIGAWKKVTDAVHAKGSYMYLQLWALGRAANPAALAAEGLPLVSASNIPNGTSDIPRPLTVEEIQEYIHLYATAASNAVHKAGFDGVEIHSANGYLLNQFLHDQCSNVRTDSYGGSIENRVRFPLEVVQAVVNAVGETKTGFRISPWGTWNDMYFGDPKPTYTHLVTELRDRYPDLAYLHVVEPRVDGITTVESVNEGYSNDFIREIWGSRPLISAGGYTRETALAAAEEKGDLVAFARPYISNPDLPYRLLHGIALAVGNRALYYAPGSSDPAGYTDYPFASVVEAH